MIYNISKVLIKIIIAIIIFFQIKINFNMKNKKLLKQMLKLKQRQFKKMIC